MALIKCDECKKEISDKATICPHCGCPIEEKAFCNECGKEINLNDEICKNCGCPISSVKSNINDDIGKTKKQKKLDIKEPIKNISNLIKKNKKVSMIVAVVLVILIIMIAPNFKHLVKPKIDVTATTLSELSRLELIYGKDINFDDIISGGTCLSGRQTITIKSEKYGTVTAEYYYCKLKNDVYLHMYN